MFDAQLSGAPSAALAPDGLTVAVSGDEGVSLWSLDGRGLIARGLPRRGHSEVTLSGDGRWAVLSAPDERPPDLYDLSDAQPRRVALPGRPSSHYGHLGAMDGLLTWHLRDPLIRYRPFDALDGDGMALSGGSVVSTTYSPATDLLAIADGPPQGRAVVRVFSLADGHNVSGPLDALLPGDPDAQTLVHSLSFSPDGRRLIAATNDGAAVIWDTDTWQVTARVSQGGGQVAVAQFSPDGRWLVTTSSDGVTVLRDPRTLQPVGGPLLGQTDAVEGYTHGPRFTADGRHMVTTADGKARLWDLRERVVVGTAFPNDPGTSPAASADARWLGTFVGDHVRIWNLDVAAWAEIACRAAGRNLTRSEWEQLGPGDADYRPTCDMWPAHPRDEEEQQS